MIQLAQSLISFGVIPWYLFAGAALFLVMIALLVFTSSRRPSRQGQKPASARHAQLEQALGEIFTRADMTRLGPFAYRDARSLVRVSPDTLQISVTCTLRAFVPLPLSFRDTYGGSWQVNRHETVNELTLPKTLLLESLVSKDQEEQLEQLELHQRVMSYEMRSLRFHDDELSLDCQLEGCFVNTSLRTTDPEYTLDTAILTRQMNALLGDVEILATLDYHTSLASYYARCLELAERAPSATDWRLFALRFAHDELEARRAESEVESAYEAAMARESLEQFDRVSLCLVYDRLDHATTEEEKLARARVLEAILSRSSMSEFLESPQIEDDEKEALWHAMCQDPNPAAQTRAHISEVLQTDSYAMSKYFDEFYAERYAHLWHEPWWSEQLTLAVKKRQLGSIEDRKPLVIVKKGHIKHAFRPRIEVAKSTAEFITTLFTRECLDASPYSLGLDYTWRRKIYLAHPRHAFSSDYVAALASDSPIEHIEAWMSALPEDLEPVWLPLLFERVFSKEVSYLMASRWTAMACFERMCAASFVSEHLDRIDEGASHILADNPDLFAELPMQQELDRALAAYTDLARHQGRYAEVIGVLQSLTQRARPEVRALYEARRDALVDHARAIGLDGALSRSDGADKAGGLSLK